MRSPNVWDCPRCFASNVRQLHMCAVCQQANPRAGGAGATPPRHGGGVSSPPAAFDPAGGAGPTPPHRGGPRGAFDAAAAAGDLRGTLRALRAALGGMAADFGAEEGGSGGDDAVREFDEAVGVLWKHREVVVRAHESLTAARRVTDAAVGVADGGRRSGGEDGGSEAVAKLSLQIEQEVERRQRVEEERDLLALRVSEHAVQVAMWEEERSELRRRAEEAERRCEVIPSLEADRDKLEELEEIFEKQQVLLADALFELRKFKETAAS